jgi:hypothetical protein
MKVPKDRELRGDALIKVANTFGGSLSYSTSNHGAYVRIGTPPFHVDIHPGDSIVKKGPKAVVAKGYMEIRARVFKKNPELKHLVPHIESLIHQSITFK